LSSGMFGATDQRARVVTPSGRTVPFRISGTDGAGSENSSGHHVLRPRP
jgi:hypothetical protein